MKKIIILSLILFLFLLGLFLPKKVEAGELIMYKSAGAGAMTETSDATLAPLTPATVDAGDILIAHIVVLDATSALSTPSGWTLLFGPSGLGTGTPTGRAWAYGRIADGSEDNAFIDFGSLASTVGRMGRIYSFSGYVSGSITDVVPSASFAENSSETDPVIQAVTASVTGGSKAVSLVSQDDNNSHIDLGVVSGGHWREAVADYADANVGVQGGKLQIQVGTPDSNPGTIGSGTINGTDDEANTLNFEIRSNPLPTVALSGTVTSSITEADIVAGGKTIILTATNGTFVPAAGGSGSEIGYKSAGAGAMTETSGANLNIVAPPTVDANDILIAHIVYLDNATGPSTPSGWTLLFGPSGLGTGTPTGRAWAFGKIADGSEDGATIDFGTAGGTTGRMGRIYSFSGYVSGSITDVVPSASFAENSSETDPVVQDVTTTATGAKAISLVSQDDNNPHIPLGGVSGGEWTEPTADYTDANVGVQGGKLEIQVGIPHTSVNLGTISGGTIAGVDDEANTLNFEIRSNVPSATTPFADARQAIIDGIDSAQSEGTGWDAVVKAGQGVTGVVRTSNTVVTVTLDAFATFNITAQETITSTVPDSSLTDVGAVVAAPTFTIDIVAGFNVTGNLLPTGESGNEPGQCDGSTQNLSLRVNGGTAVTAFCTDTSGAFTFSGVTASQNDTITIYSTGADKANRVYVSDGSADSSMNLYEDKVAIGDEQDGTVTIPDLWDYDATANNTDMLFDAVDAATDTLTTESGIELHIHTGDTFDPGGTVTTTSGNLHIDDNAVAEIDNASSVIGADVLIDGGATFRVNASVAINGGDITTSGTSAIVTTTSGTPTVTISGTGSIGGGTTPTLTFYNLATSGSGTTTIANGTTVNNDLSIGSGTTLQNDAALTVTGDVAVTGKLTIASTLTVNGGALTTSGTGVSGVSINYTNTPTATIDATGNLGGGTGSVTFYNLTLGDGSGSATTTLATDTIVIDNALSVAANQTFAMGIYSLAIGSPSISDSGDVTINGITSQSSSGTVTIQGNSNAADWSGSGTFTVNNLTIGDESTTMTVDNESSDLALDVNGNLEITSNATFQASSTSNFTVGGNWLNNSVFTSNTGTVTMDGTSGTLEIVSNGDAFHNLNIDNGGSSITWMLVDPLDVNGNILIDTNNTLDAQGLNINVAGNWTNNGTFTPNGNTVFFDGVGGSTQTILGTNTFYALSITTSSARTVKFPSSVTTTITNSLTLTGASSQLLTIAPSTASTTWTFSAPTTTSVSYVSISYGANSGTTFCATNSTNGGNNTGFSISTGASCSGNPTAYSFQRKTWYDGTRYWRSYLDTVNSRIRFDYSADGSSWTEDTGARISTNTSDFSVVADSSNAYVAYTTSSVSNQDTLLTDSALRAYWKMNESSWNGTSNEVVDSSGNSLHGTRNGGATTTSSGKFDYAGTFDGTDDYVAVSDPGTSSVLDFANTTTITMAAWIYPTSLPGVGTWQTIATKGAIDNTDDANYILEIGNMSGTEVITLCFTSSGSFQCWNGTGMDLVQDQWQHIAIKFTFGTASSIRTYHNGVEYATGNWDTGTGTGSPDVTNKALWIGANNYNDGTNEPQEEFFGRIDDLRIYNRGLSATDIAALGQPGYDVVVRKASSYPGTGFSWSGEIATYNGASASDYYQNPVITQDTNSKVWVGAPRNNGGTYTFNATRAASANDIVTWDSASSLDSSANSNKYGVLVPRASGAAYAIWIDNATIEGKNYNGTSWDGSPTTIDTGLTGLLDTFSAVADSSGNVYLEFVEDDTTDRISHTKWNGTSWTTPVGVADTDDTNDTYPTITLDTTASRLYAFWIDSSNNDIFYSTCDTSSNCDSASEWSAEVSWQTTGTNEYITSNYSGAGLIFAEWFDGSGIDWDKITTNTAPSVPTTLYTNESETTAQAGVANPVGVGDASPVFSAINNDADDGDVADKYEIIVYSDSGCSAQVWDSGSNGTSMTNCTEGNRCADINFAGTDLPFDGTKYYWKIRYWDDEPAAGNFSNCADNFTMLSPAEQLRHGNYFFNLTTERRYTW